MTSKRTLKKNVKNIFKALVNEGIAASLYEDVNHENVEAYIVSAIHMKDDFVSRISHVAPYEAKTFYKKLLADFDKQVGEAIDQISNLHQ